MPKDLSNGYESVAKEFIAIRSNTGRDLVENWARSLPKNGDVIDLGAGFGEPLTSALVAADLNVRAIDASPTMVSAFKTRFPKIEVACEAAEDSDLFGRHYDGILAVGLMFLLKDIEQETLIKNIGRALKPQGKFLFSAPTQTHYWEDLLTGQMSYSLGKNRYSELIEAAEMRLVAEYKDEGGSHYYEAASIKTLSAS